MRSTRSGSAADVGRDEPLGLLIKRLHQAIRSAAEDALRAQGVSLPQLGVLSALRQAPGLSNAELARASFVTPPSMVELAAVLKRRGLITQRSHSEGGRTRQLELTPGGLATLKRCQAAVAEVEDRLLGPLTHEQQSLLRKFLRLCLNSFDVSPPAGAQMPIDRDGRRATPQADRVQ